MISTDSQNSVLITGGAGFIGSNLCDFFIEKNYKVVCLDNFSTGSYHNISHLVSNPNFTLIEGDIRNLSTCEAAVKNIDYVLHHAALGSVPRSINNPILTNEVNISGFLNVLVASRDAKVKRFIYAASSSTYGDSASLPKMEEVIGKPLSPYAITKYVNELYADIFSKTYGMQTIGLRYFNVFGRRQNPDGAYAAVIPKFINAFLRHESPIINGDGNYSRDFTYIDNVLQMNELAILTENPKAVNTVYNTAFGERTTLNDLTEIIKQSLINIDKDINNIAILYQDNRAGDIPHSLADIHKAKNLLNYNPQYSLKQGIEESIGWYFQNFNNVKINL